MLWRAVAALGGMVLRIVGWLALAALLVARGQRIEREKQARRIAAIREDWARRWAGRPRSRAELRERVRRLGRRQGGPEPTATGPEDAELPDRRD
ncbi:MAG: hypothetical protein Alpg2KO_06910 [Alphaproteobacteria bacterium]